MFGPIVFDSAMDFMGMGTCTDPEIMRMVREYENRRDTDSEKFDGGYGCFGYGGYVDDWERECDE